MLKIAMNALVTRFCRSPTVTVTNLLDKDRAELVAAPEGKVVNAQVHD
jgi:hypothetical protein